MNERERLALILCRKALLAIDPYGEDMHCKWCGAPASVDHSSYCPYDIAVAASDQVLKEVGVASARAGSTIYKLDELQDDVQHWKTNFQYALNWQAVYHDLLTQIDDMLDGLDIPVEIHHKDSITSLLVHDRVAILVERYKNALALLERLNRASSPREED